MSSNQFIAAITVAINNDGDTETHYFTDGPGWTTRPTDTPANTWIQPRLLDPGSYRRELFSGNQLWGAVRPSFGELVLANSDGVLDGWLDYGVDGRAVTIYWGDPDTKQERLFQNFAAGDDLGDDLTVDRDSTATYVDVDGVTQTALADTPRFDYSAGEWATNLVHASNKTNVAGGWLVSNATATFDQVGILGEANTATLVTDSTNAHGYVNRVAVGGTLADGQVFTTRAFIKKAASDPGYICLLRSNSSVTNNYCDLRLDTYTGQIAGTQVGTALLRNSAVVDDYGDWWAVSLECEVDYAAGLTSAIAFYPAVGFTLAGYNSSATGSAVIGNIERYLLPIEQVRALPPVFTTTAPVSKIFDSSVRRLLLEPEATNFVRSSHDITIGTGGWQNLVYGVGTCTVTTGFTDDFGRPAVRIQATSDYLLPGDNYGGLFLQESGLDSAAKYHVKFRAKSNTASSQVVWVKPSATSSTGNMSVTVTTEWQDFEISTITVYGGGTPQTLLQLACGSRAPTGDDSVDVLFSAPQVVLGEVSSSYIPTSGTRVTRAADSLLYSGIAANNETRAVVDGANVTIADWDGAADSSLLGAISHIGVYGNEFPADWTTVLKCYGHTLIADFDSVRLRLRDRLILLDTPFATGKFLGTGGIEGAANLKDVVKPRASGQVQNYIEPVLLDASLLLYFVADAGNPAGSYSQLSEGGYGVTSGTDYASEAEMLSTAPSIGQCRWYRPTGGPAYVRLGSTPEFGLRVNPIYPFTIVYPSQDLGITVDDGGGPTLHSYVTDSTTYLEVASQAATAASQFFGFTRLDVWQCETVLAPAVTAVFDFTRNNAKDIRRDTTMGHAPVHRVTINAAATYPQTDLVGALGAYDRENLSRQGFRLTSSAEDETVLIKHPTSPSLEIDLPTYQSFVVRPWVALSTITSFYLSLFGTSRDLITFVAPFTDDTMSLDINDTISLTMPRFGLSAGKNFLVVATELHLKRKEINFTVWG